MIEQLRKIPESADSHPFGRASVKCGFDSAGYVEDEYFIKGTANLYEADDCEQARVIYHDAPYVNRMLVRRPGNTECFSGRIVIEILNATAMMDLDRIWVNTWKFFIRNGDIYIGLTSKPDVFDALRAFDRRRYDEISWKNPMPERGIPEKYSFFSMDPEHETGLIWDMLVDLAKLLRNDSDKNPLAGYKHRKLYLTGWSQSAGYVVRMVKSFVYRSENCEHGPLFDGYLQAGANSRVTAINLYDYTRYPDDPRGFFYTEKYSMITAREPYIAVNTESENMQANWGGDSDTPGALLRVYEIPGASHDSKYNMLDYYAGDEDVAKIGKMPFYRGIDTYPNDYPCEVLFHWAFTQLYRWSDGIVPPHAPRILKNGVRVNRTDAFGNARGGLRTAALNYPLCRYEYYSILPDGRMQTLFGHAMPFSSVFLKELYGSAERYEKLIREDTQFQAENGFLLAEDVEAFVRRMVGQAHEYGLE